MVTITVYGKPGCVQCTATKRALDTAGVAYSEVDVSTDDAALEHVKALGFSQAPVVECDDTAWSGFRPDLIDQLTR